MKRQQLDESDVLALWKRFDLNKDGIITRNEFSYFLSVSFKKQFNVELSFLPTALVDEVFNMFDLNHSGNVVYHEFKECVNNFWTKRESIDQHVGALFITSFTMERVKTN
jgi:Ca2+-binding EF-hand superfamily protein